MDVSKVAGANVDDAVWFLPLLWFSPTYFFKKTFTRFSTITTRPVLMGFGQAQKITWICNPVGPVPMGTGKGRGLDLWTLRIADSFLRCGMSPLQRGPELAQDGTRYHCVHRCTQWYLAFLQDSGEKQVSPFQDWPMLVWGHLQAPGCASSLWRFSIFLERNCIVI